jgi:hypothetical protein
VTAKVLIFRVTTMMPKIGHGGPVMLFLENPLLKRADSSDEGKIFL